MLEAAVRAGARDGVTHAATCTVDGTDLEVQQAVVALFGAVVPANETGTGMIIA
jgi:hypothetical protein